MWHIEHCFLKRGHEHACNVSVGHFLTNTISFYLFKARYRDIFSLPFFLLLLLFFLTSCFLGVAFSMEPKVLPLNSVSSFSHCRFPGKPEQLHFSALEGVERKQDRMSSHCQCTGETMRKPQQH